MLKRDHEKVCCNEQWSCSEAFVRPRYPVRSPLSSVKLRKYKYLYSLQFFDLHADVSTCVLNESMQPVHIKICEKSISKMTENPSIDALQKAKKKKKCKSRKMTRLTWLTRQTRQIFPPDRIREGGARTVQHAQMPIFSFDESVSQWVTYEHQCKRCWLICKHLTYPHNCICNISHLSTFVVFRPWTRQLRGRGSCLGSIWLGHQLLQLRK